MKPYATSVSGLLLLVYAALSYALTVPRRHDLDGFVVNIATIVSGLKLFVYQA